MTEVQLAISGTLDRGRWCGEGVVLSRREAESSLPWPRLTQRCAWQRAGGFHITERGQESPPQPSASSPAAMGGTTAAEGSKEDVVKG